MSKFYLTTPIYYVNDLPHIGTAYTTIAADVLARYHRQQNDEVLFATGSDENGQKIVQAAEKAHQTPAEYVDTMAKSWQQTWDQLGISHDRFIRTTDKDHIAGVRAFIAAVQASDDMYKGVYEGLYCVGCEEFKKESDLVNGHCPEHPNQELEHIKEDNYFFRLSKYQDQLLQHIEANPNFVQPESRRNEVIQFIKHGLEDFSVSRPNKGWGIPWPDDKDQVVYVWFDALVNYLVVAGYPNDASKWWPADLHLVGKNIIKFHCVYWQAMLMSAGLPLPQRVFAHGFFTVDGQKISKSLGNAINPVELAGTYGVDALRFYLLREITFGGDGEFSHERFRQVYQSELADDLGNAVQRVASMIGRYLGGTISEVPKSGHDVGLVHQAMAELRLDKALDELWVHVRSINQYIEQEKPWELAKTDPNQLTLVLQQSVADLLHVAELLLPFMPATAQRIAQTFAGGQVHPEVGILFPKFDEAPAK
ncbi:MAG TPA: methionine--tRNA ligase [Candidatus Saccharimonadia bacterium]